MQFFYVTQDITLRYAGKVLHLVAPPKELLDKKSLSLAHLRCGFIAWEAIKAKEMAGDSAAVILPPHPEILRFLPPQIQPFSLGVDLVEQLRQIRGRRPQESKSKPLRIALINGFGTMLGDNLAGLSALEEIVENLKHSGIGDLDIHAYLAWNAIPGTELILSRSPAIDFVQSHSITLAELRTFDAFWDFSSLLKMNGYDSSNIRQFYLDHLGVNPLSSRIPSKPPAVRIDPDVLSETMVKLETHLGNCPFIFLQLKASTDVRSMPTPFSRRLIEAILASFPVSIVLAQQDFEDSFKGNSGRVLNLGHWTANNLDRYMSLIAISRAVITVDTFALHVAQELGKPGVGLFTVLNPAMRLRTDSRVRGLLIPGAESLPYWGKHKSDGNWSSIKPQYEHAWEQLNLNLILSCIQRELPRN